jgi:ATP-dependent Clp protease ATP-binding subunit ClpA
MLGSDPERDPRAERAVHPDPVRRRGSHHGGRRLALGAPSDAANIFKSVLARGDPDGRATTLSEHKDIIQEDEALARRFRCDGVRAVNRGDPQDSLQPAAAARAQLSVRLLDEAIETVELSPRYMRNLHLPDKVIGWLDTAAVRAEIDRWEVRTKTSSR